MDNGTESTVDVEMSEAEAWLIVAEEFAAGNTEVYICLVLSNLDCNDRISTIPFALRHRMKQFIKSLLGVGDLFAYNTYPFSDQKDGAYHKARLTALCLFAAMAEDGATNV